MLDSVKHTRKGPNCDYDKRNIYLVIHLLHGYSVKLNHIMVDPNPQ